MENAGVQGALAITLEVGQYWIRQRGLVGAKEVELERAMDEHQLPQAFSFLTGTGRLDRDFRFRLLDDEIRALRTARRDDLPGAPLVWQAALDALVGHLTGRGPRTAAGG